MLGACASPSFLARTSHVNVSATSLALVCVDPEEPDETRRDCLLRRLNRGIKLAEDIGLAFGTSRDIITIRLRGDELVNRTFIIEFYFIFHMNMYI